MIKAIVWVYMRMNWEFLEGARQTDILQVIVREKHIIVETIDSRVVEKSAQS
jgi:hypothetical protein